MKRNAAWASTHPAYDVMSGQYVCACGQKFNHNQELLRHCIDREPPNIAIEVLSTKEYQKYLKGAGR